MEWLRDIADAIWLWIGTNWGFTPDPGLKSWIELGAGAVAMAGGLLLPFKFYNEVWIKPRERRRQRAREEEDVKRQKAALLRENERDAQIGQMHQTIHEMAQRIAQMQAMNAASPVSAEAQSATVERIEAAATDLAGRTDERSQAAFAALRRGDTNLAKRLYSDILAERSQEGSAANKEAAEAARNIAAFTRLQNVSEAADLYAQAARLDPENIVNWIDLGDLSRDAGRLGDARRAFEVAIETAERFQDHWWTMAARNRLGDVVLAAGNLGQALELYSEARKHAQCAADADPKNAGWQRDLSVSHTKVGDVLVAQGKLGEALTAFEASLRIAERLASSDPGNVEWQRDLAVSHERVGDIRSRTNDPASAKQAFQNALKIYDALVDRNPDDLPSLVNSVVPRLRLARLDSANKRRHLSRALDILKGLAEQNRLDAMRTSWIPDIERQLAELRE